MKERAGKKKVVLELGGNAGVIVDKTADLDWAVRRTLVGAFSYAGQVCISVQRMFVHEDVWDAFMAKFVEGARALKLGDPLDPQTDVGPMVDEQRRVADPGLGRRGAGAPAARRSSGGKADGSFFPPTILTDVPVTAAVCSNEAFAPLVVAFKFRDIDDAIAQVNDSFVRAPDRDLHERPRPRLAGVPRARGRRRDRQRRARPTGSTTCRTAG